VATIDNKDLQIIHKEIESMNKSIEEMKLEMDEAHAKVEKTLSSIKENLFNPHEGLWSETKLNSQFRHETKRWRGIVGTGVVGLIIKQIWDFMKI